MTDDANLLVATTPRPAPPVAAAARASLAPRRPVSRSPASLGGATRIALHVSHTPRSPAPSLSLLRCRRRRRAVSALVAAGLACSPPSPWTSASTGDAPLVDAASRGEASRALDGHGQPAAEPVAIPRATATRRLRGRRASDGREVRRRRERRGEAWRRRRRGKGRRSDEDTEGTSLHVLIPSSSSPTQRDGDGGGATRRDSGRGRDARRTTANTKARCDTTASGEALLCKK